MLSVLLCDEVLLVVRLNYVTTLRLLRGPKSCGMCDMPHNLLLSHEFLTIQPPEGRVVTRWYYVYR